MKATLKLNGRLAHTALPSDISSETRDICAYFETELIAKKFAASLPQYIRARVEALRGVPVENAWGLVVSNNTVFGVRLVIRRSPTKRTGTANEAGERRLAAFIAALNTLELG